MLDLCVLYQDNHLIAVYKPPGLLTQGDRTGDPNLLDEVKGWLAYTYAKPGRVFLGLLHRLDRPVSGVVLFARTSKAAARLSQQFRERSVDKCYLARVEGALEPPSGRLCHHLAPSHDAGSVRVSDRPGPETKPAALTYSTRCVQGAESTLLIRLETGRKHQIRAQLAHVGHPICGDRRYGAKRGFAPGGIGLCAIELGFAHPITKQPMRVTLPQSLRHTDCRGGPA